MTAYRKLIPTDLPELVRHLQELEPEDRRRRFQGGVSDEAIAVRCQRIDWLRTVLIGRFAAGRLEAVAEVAFDRVFGPIEAEVAVTVEHGLQGRGVGTELMRRAVVSARNRGAKTLRMICLTENQAMQRIARRLTEELHFEPGGVEASVQLARPNALSWWQEALQDGSGAWLSVTDQLLAA